MRRNNLALTATTMVLTDMNTAPGAGGTVRPQGAATPAARGIMTTADGDAELAGDRSRNEVWPVRRRGASRLSPYIRHGMRTLPRVWEHVTGGPGRDVAKFRDELLWQEYARHLYARLERRTARPLRHDPSRRSPAAGHPWDWRDGEDLFFTHLLHGSRAANRLGWQWTVGSGTGRAYGLSRHQVRKRAPGVCRGCPLERACPIADWPDALSGSGVDAEPLLRADPDPALAAHPGLPAVFVFDDRLPGRLRLSAKRLVFLVETLAEMAAHRAVEVHRGDPTEVLAGRPVAVTHAPVPGFTRGATTQRGRWARFGFSP